MIKYLIEKEFKQLWRNPFILFLIIVLPALVMLVFPWATTMEIKHLNVAVVDNDRSDLSRRLTDKIASTEYFDITGVFMRSDEAMEQVEFGDADIILEVPYGFEDGLLSEGSASLLVEANAVNGTKASLGTSYLDMVALDFSRDLNLDSGSVSVTAAGGIGVDSYYWFNPLMDYKVPMIPALVMLIMALITGFLPAMNIVGEKEAGTIEQINVTPVPKITFIVGKLIPYWVIGIIVLSVGMLVAWLLYGLRPEGSVLLLYGLSLVFIFGISGLGLIISNYSNNMQQAMFMIFFIIIVFILMCGVFTPVSSMPEWARVISMFDPFTYFAQIMSMIYLKGSTFRDILQYVYPLLAFFVVIIGWAVFSYRKRG
ncbi:MAG TPA: ABC transporter permease [Candidatus Coprenecus pullistercoris]|nr:ABC transporter permease [Candidatus Coprenecus pullistercoris]